MSKHIVLFSDGTGNSSAKLFKTNVWRLYQALDLSGPNTDSPDKPIQIAYYDDGVGTSGFKPLALLGGAFGWGLKRNVLDLYTFLSWNYKAGDQIYCFGFSRGAFTIRILSELIRCQGLVTAQNKRDLRKLATNAFNTHRRQCRRGHHKNRLRSLFNQIGLNQVSDSLGESYPTTNTVVGPPITFLGLWDTVGAYGLPIDELTRAWNAVFPIRPKHTLDQNVHRACHALALDDERNSFHPQLINEHKTHDHDPSRTKDSKDERVAQVWFAGAHTNVGGGYPDDGLAYVSLAWMMQEAKQNGLRFKDDDYKHIQQRVNPLGKIYDARQGVGGVYRYLPRKLEYLTNNDDDRYDPVRITCPKIHESVIKRIRAGVDGYAPIGLPAHYSVVTADGRILDPPTPDDAPSELIEHAETAARRTQHQETVWNVVWWKRIAYFLSVIVAGGLVTFPLYKPATEACTGALCALSPVIEGIGLFLPSILSPWLDAFESHPGTLSGLIIVLVILIVIGGHLQVTITDRMRTLWKPFTHPTEFPMHETTAAFPNDFIYRLRTHWFYQAFFKLMKQRIFPFVAGLASVFLILQGASHVMFSMMSSGGFICHETQKPSIAAETPRQQSFSSNALCWGSGIQLTEGTRYRITLSIHNPSSWNDSGINADLHGFTWKHMTPPMYAGLLMRRHLTEPWFKPIARIGSQGSDEYPLNPITPIRPEEITKQIFELTAELTARRNGELFLFLNDAIVPGPESWQVFYKNNAGNATVTVQPIEEHTPTGLVSHSRPSTQSRS